MTYVAKRFYLETQEASVIGRAANRQDAIEMLCEGIVDTYEREQGRSRYDIKDILTKARKDACHYYREGEEVTSWFLVAEEKDSDVDSVGAQDEQ